MSCTESRPSRSISVREVLPLALAERGREHTETRPKGCPVEPGEHRAREAQVTRNERRWPGRRLEGEPAVVSDLGECDRALGEVHAPGAGPTVAGPSVRVLDVHALDEPAERANLGRGVQSLVGERVGEVEVAAESIRADASRDGGDALGRERPFEAEADAVLRGLGHSARNAATARSSSASFTSSARMKNGTRTTPVSSSLAHEIALRTSACARCEISLVASAIPPSTLCSPSTSAGPVARLPVVPVVGPRAVGGTGRQGRLSSGRPRRRRSPLAVLGQTPRSRHGHR